MKSREKLSRRRATWLAFGLVALASISSAQGSSSRADGTTSLSNSRESSSSVISATISRTPKNEPPISSQQALDPAAEATRAYKQAIYTLSTISNHSPAYTYDSFFTTGYSSNPSSNTHTKSLLSALLPNVQGRGPIGNALRIIIKLQHRIVNTLSAISKDRLGFGAQKSKEAEIRGKLIKIIDLLQHSAELGHTDALYTLAQISLFTPTIYFPSNPQLAYDSFTTHAALTGNATSQGLLAFFHATGYRGIVPVDQAKAQLYYTFAANGGDRGSQMALAYRYWSGIGTLEDCERAVDWYERSSEQAMKHFVGGPPGGSTLPQTATRLSDLVGGVYGYGSSVASSGLNAHRPSIRAGMSRASGETWPDILDYYLFNADRQETEFAYRLGKIFYQGSIYASAGGIASGSEGVGAIPRDFLRARHYFLQIARQVWPRDPANPLNYKPSAPAKDERLPVGHAAGSAGYLGRTFLRGEGVKIDYGSAKMWFERGVEYSDRECHNGLGIMWRDGLVPGHKQDMKKAIYHFTAAASQELAEAQVNLAKVHFERGELTAATTWFETAMRHGSPFEAYYYLGRIHSAQSSSPDIPKNIASGSCSMAVSFYKIASERGVWNDNLLKDAEAFWMTGTDHGKEAAMLRWWIAAERGYEVAQNNLAYVLDQDRSLLRLTRFTPIVPSNDTARLALTQWIRASAQRDLDALVKVGDYYYHGLGVPDDPPNIRYEKAARYYRSAADTQLSALAMWNMGWMYENGVGVPQDFHLAKRHYDLALETNPEAYLPVMLSLAKLFVKSFWHTAMGGTGGLSIWYPDEESVASKVKEVPKLEENAGDALKDQEEFHDEEDSNWYIGKAKDEFRRRRGPVPEEEDPIQWARNRRNAEQERDSDFGPEDYFEGALRGGDREGDSDEFSETMILVVLVVAVSILIYVRTRIVDRVRRDQEDHPPREGQQRNDGGLFPPGEDPARQEWAILR